MSPNNHIVWLNETNSTHTQATIGSKAANLAKLCNAGLPVPAAFCITIDAWVDHFANTDQTVASPPDTTELLSAVSPGSDLEREILEAYRKLCARFGEKTEVAVRSSALSEDMADASFAGQYESYLNIQNEGDLLTAVKRCWASG
ncbi:MAG: phosphoenolpyruvate synthase, partial [Chloroflexi bacterium]